MSKQTDPREQFDKWYEDYPDETLYMDGMYDAFVAGYQAATPAPAEEPQRIEAALTEISQIVLQGLPKDAGYIFYANDVRKVLIRLAAHPPAEPRFDWEEAARIAECNGGSAGHIATALRDRGRRSEVK